MLRLDGRRLTVAADGRFRARDAHPRTLLATNANGDAIGLRFGPPSRRLQPRLSRADRRVRAEIAARVSRLEQAVRRGERRRDRPRSSTTGIAPVEATATAMSSGPGPPCFAIARSSGSGSNSRRSTRETGYAEVQLSPRFRGLPRAVFRLRFRLLRAAAAASRWGNGRSICLPTEGPALSLIGGSSGGRQLRPIGSRARALLRPADLRNPRAPNHLERARERVAEAALNDRSDDG